MELEQERLRLEEDRRRKMMEEERRRMQFIEEERQLREKRAQEERERQIELAKEKARLEQLRKEQQEAAAARDPRMRGGPANPYGGRQPDVVDIADDDEPPRSAPSPPRFSQYAQARAQTAANR